MRQDAEGPLTKNSKYATLKSSWLKPWVFPPVSMTGIAATLVETSKKLLLLNVG
jgi:hypothetical protein